MFCSKCGAQVTEGTTFCGACGQPVSALPAPGVIAPAAAPAYIPAYNNAAAAVILPSPYAGFWLRVVAYIIDALLVGVLFGILVLVGIGFMGVGYVREAAEGMNNPDVGPPIALIMMFVVLGVASMFVVWLYYAYMESSPNQGTFGKMALGLIVTDLQGRRISFGRATGRFFAKIVTGLIPLGIGYMMAGFTERKQALHDMIAGCLVLRKN